jgi:hypothetical protein
MTTRQPWPRGSTPSPCRPRRSRRRPRLAAEHHVTGAARPSMSSDGSVGVCRTCSW